MHYDTEELQILIVFVFIVTDGLYINKLSQKCAILGKLLKIQGLATL